MSDAVRAQGAEAKKLGLSEYDCPYGPGENRDKWMGGFGGKKEEVREPVIQGATSPNEPTRQVRKGAKGAETAAVVKPTGTGETAVTTVTETAEPQNSDHVGAEVTIGDPSASTTAAENAGEGLNTGLESDGSKRK